MSSAIAAHLRLEAGIAVELEVVQLAIVDGSAAAPAR